MVVPVIFIVEIVHAAVDEESEVVKQIDHDEADCDQIKHLFLYGKLD